MFDHSNYQLYRSNVRLGGQMKYDIVVDSYKDKLYVKDFHITPVSDSCPFNRHTQETLLNYSHKENISRYYKQISGSFYNPFIDPMLTNPYPLMQKGNEFVNNHDSTFEMGCKRMRNYQLYNKQFEFFCPVWLEKLSKDQTISFRFETYADNNYTKIISVKTLKLETSNLPKTAYHDKFVKYFRDWIEYLGIEEGDNSVMNINPIKNIAEISGVNMSSGLKEVKTLPRLIENMFKREIPLLEFDDRIIRNFEDNNLITKQLFNFNFCFNLEDIIKAQTMHLIQKQPLYIKMSVLIGEEELGKRDLFTNYEYIPKKSCDIPEVTFNRSGFEKINPTNNPNVLSYLRDNECIDYVLENKMSPQIIHWSLVGNNSYIFNVYNGFGGYYKSENGIVSLSQVYDNSSNIMLDKNIKSQNSLTWCNMIKLKVEEDPVTFDINKLITDLDKLEKFYSRFSTRGGWTNHIMYNPSDSENDVDIDILVMFVSPDYYDIIGYRGGYFYPCFESEDGKYIVLKINNKYLFVAKENEMNTDTFIYKNFLGNVLLSLQDKPEFSDLNILSDIMDKRVSYPASVSLSSTVMLARAKGPTLDTSEIEYYKDDTNKSEPMFRYFGKIRPCFVSVEDDINFNYRYSKNVMKVGQPQTTSQMEILDKYLKLGFPPKYPSINYYYITKDVETYKTFEHQTNNLRDAEWKLFDSNKVPMLVAELETVLSNEFNPELTVDERVKEFFGNMYGINGSTLDYIHNLYSYDMSFDYKRLDDVNLLNYFLKITLK